MPFICKNFARSTLASNLNIGGTSLSLQTGHGAARFSTLGTDYTKLVIVDASKNYEVVKGTARSGDTITVVRAQEGTTERNWTSGASVYEFPTAAEITAVVNHAALATAAHAASAISVASSGSPFVADDVQEAIDDLYATTYSIVGQCRFNYVSATQCRLNQYGGDKIKINGVLRSIPSAGITISNGGLSSSTLYYCYAYWSGSAIALEFSTTGHTTHTNGVEIKSGDATRTLVGMVWANSSAQFSDTDKYRFTASWFNRRLRSCQSGLSINRSYSGAFSKLHDEAEIFFLSWGDEAIEVTSNLTATSATLQNIGVLTAIDAVQIYIGAQLDYVAASGAYACVKAIMALDVSEGLRTATLHAYTSGSAMTCQGSYTGIHALPRI